MPEKGKRKLAVDRPDFREVIPDNKAKETIFGLQHWPGV